MKLFRKTTLGVAISLCVSCFPSFASDVEITKVVFEKKGETYNFHVTLKHADSGWDHYANIWRVEGVEGEVYGTRELAHPHVNEQPFTRSLSGVKIPAGVTKIIVRAGDNISGLTPGGKTIELE